MLCKFTFNLLFIFAISATFAQVETWSYREKIPVARGEMAGVLLDDKIYLGGGFGGVNNVTDAMQAYVPEENKWIGVPPMPFSLHHANFGAINGKLYVLGGCDHGTAHPGVVPWLGSTHSAVFDPQSQKWTKLTNPIPRSTMAAGVAAFDGKLYVIGGSDTAGVVLDLVQEYDPENETWRNRKPMPTFREHLGIAVLDSLIYVAAGRQEGRGGVSFTSFEAYSPRSDTWYVLPDVPTARSGIGMTAINGKVYVLGGEWPGVFDLVEVYDPAENKWDTTTHMLHARHGFLAEAYKDTIYALGPNDLTEAFHAPPPTSVKINFRQPSTLFPSMEIQLSFPGFKGTHDVMGRENLFGPLK